MALTLVIECPFEEKTATFTLIALCRTPKGKEIARFAKSWQLVAVEERFGPFSYARFQLIGKDEILEVDSDPEKIRAQLLRYHQPEIQDFLRKLGRNHGFIPNQSWLGNLGFGEQPIKILQLPPYLRSYLRRKKSVSSS